MSKSSSSPFRQEKTVMDSEKEEAARELVDRAYEAVLKEEAEAAERERQAERRRQEEQALAELRRQEQQDLEHPRIH